MRQHCWVWSHPEVEEVGVKRETVWKGTFHGPKSPATRMKAHPSFIVDTTTRSKADRALMDFWGNPALSLSERQGSGSALNCPPTKAFQVQFFKPNFCTGLLANLLVPDIGDAKIGHHIVPVWELSPNDSVSIA